ncbi:hypothetical protein EDS67_09480 [candidate division KSB1 bacterium]|nr:MAG: hypothetical protein EDS67_09480 [candidate division KSB1 bacterium]MBC6948401.1 hypothetical protein [candidate division KSB1 bacterium]MCE7943924.1 hypothetical protein [Chlorobi bacterium CHB1]
MLAPAFVNDTHKMEIYSAISKLGQARLGSKTLRQDLDARRASLTSRNFIDPLSASRPPPYGIRLYLTVETSFLTDEVWLAFAEKVCILTPEFFR